MSSTRKHRLVTIGDSLTQGFTNGCIFRPDISYPAMIARAMGNTTFRQPSFSNQGGIPLNLETLVRGVNEAFGDHIGMGQYLQAGIHVLRTARRIKDYWERVDVRGRAATTEPFHNQSIWGIAINDAWDLNDANSRAFIEANPVRPSFWDLTPNHSMLTTARCVLNPGGHTDGHERTLLGNAAWLAEHGGIENLLIFLGSNNIVGAVTELDIRYSTEEELSQPCFERNYTVYRPEHFERNFRRFAEKSARLGAERVFTSTIPHITIPPITRGVNEDLSRKRGGYFDYYTRFWIWDEAFDPDRHPHLTRRQAIELDMLVDEYNVIIKKVSAEFGFIVVPFNRFLSAMAHRRHAGKIHMHTPKGLAEAVRKREDTRYLVSKAGRVNISTEYLRLDRGVHIYKGGIFSLDGLHPTTIGYGLMANLFMEVMKKNGVAFENELDWNHIVANDTLITDPPAMLYEMRSLLRFLTVGYRERLSSLQSNLFLQIFETFFPPSHNLQAGNPSTF